MALVLGYTRATTAEDVPQHLATYTHTTCGYTRAWRDPYDPLLLWLIPDCPADEKITALKAAISNIVTTHITNTGNITDPFDRIQAIFNRATDDAGSWVQDNCYAHLAQFLSDTARIRGYIFSEMLAQGIIG